MMSPRRIRKATVNTPSHLIINAALRKRATRSGDVTIPRSAFLLGAVLPDIPLWLLWLGAYGYYRYGTS